MMPRIPTVDDVLCAVPRLDRPASVVVRAAETYLRTGKPQLAADEAGVSLSAVEHWFGRLAIRRTRSEARRLLSRQTRAEANGLRDVEERACRDYQAGEHAATVAARYQMSTCGFYATLRRRGVPLRGHAGRMPCRRAREASRRRAAAREMAEARMPRAQIAAALGVSVSSISNYLRSDD